MNEYSKPLVVNEGDQRHVSKETVDGVMKLFGKMFIKSVHEGFPATRVRAIPISCVY